MAYFGADFGHIYSFLEGRGLHTIYFILALKCVFLLLSIDPYCLCGHEYISFS